MTDRKVHSEGTYAHFVTFSCYKRRNLLQPEMCKGIVIATLSAQLKRQEGLCTGFVVMHDHIHALVWFPREHQISKFMDKWKELSSRNICGAYQRHFPRYFETMEASPSVWQDKYYGFNIRSHAKVREKLRYMHENPVRAGLVKEACDWKWSSARFWEFGKSVGISISFPP